MSAMPLGRFHPIFVETIDEQRELERFLTAKRESACWPDLLDDRRSVLPARHVTVAQYGPAHREWPYVLLCHWPPNFTRVASRVSAMLARGAYTVDLFSELNQLEAASDLLVEALEEIVTVAIEVVPPDWSLVPGARPH